MKGEDADMEAVQTCSVFSGRIGEKLAPYNPTNIDAVLLALDMLELRDNDILYDLGCGDARLLIEVRAHLMSTI